MRRLWLLGSTAALYLAWTIGVPLLRGVRSGGFTRHAEIVTWTSLGVLVLSAIALAAGRRLSKQRLSTGPSFKAR